MSRYPTLADLACVAVVPPPVPTLEEWLRAQGFRPEKDEDGTIRFSHEGRSVVIPVDAYDDAFFRVSTPDVWDIDDDTETARVLKVLNDISVGMKAVKAILVDGMVWVTIELFLDGPATFREVLPRCLDALGEAAYRVRQRLREGS